MGSILNWPQAVHAGKSAGGVIKLRKNERSRKLESEVAKLAARIEKDQEHYRDLIEAAHIELYKITIILKLYEPTTEANRRQKMEAANLISEWIEEGASFPKCVQQAHVFLGLTTGKVDKLIQSGALELSESGEVRVSSIAAYLRRMAHDLAGAA